MQKIGEYSGPLMSLPVELFCFLGARAPLGPLDVKVKAKSLKMPRSCLFYYLTVI